MTESAAPADTGDTPATIADAVGAVDVSASNTTPVVTRPDDLPEDLWDAEAGAPKFSDIKTRLEEHAALKAAQEAAAGEVFAAPEDIDWSTDVQVDGQPATFDTEDPFFKAVSAAVIEHKVPKGAFKAMLNAFAESQIANAAGARAAAEAEFKSLGETPDKAVARIKGIETAISTAIGEEKGGASKAKAFVGTLQTKAQVEVIEALLEQLRDPNPGQNAGPDAKTLLQTDPGKVFFGSKKAA